MANAPMPTTRITLLAQLRQDPTDQAAWDVFVEQYGRHIYRWCRQWKLQDADAEDVTQEILVKLSQKLRAFAYDPSRSLHVHDEAVTEIPETVAAQGLEAMCEIMSTPPAWADGFPLRVEGFTCPRYVKSPWKGISVERDYINGKPA
jgi:hypothetical protein